MNFSVISSSVISSPVTTVLLGVLVLLLAAALAFVTVRPLMITVPEDEVLIVERLGRFHGEYEAGRHVLLPFIDRVRAVVKVGDQDLLVWDERVITSDGYLLMADMEIIYEVVEPRRFTYEVDSPPRFLIEVRREAVVALQRFAHTMDSDELPRRRLRTANWVRNFMDDEVRYWGVEIRFVGLQFAVPLNVHESDYVTAYGNTPPGGYNSPYLFRNMPA